MKKNLIAVAVAICAAACGTTETKTKPVTTQPVATKPDLSTNPDYQKGLTLVAGNDCLSCHHIEKTLIGPAYRNIAGKYENNDTNATMLGERIIKGSKGIWGQVPMTPHPQISKEDAKQMAKYILLLKK